MLVIYERYKMSAQNWGHLHVSAFLSTDLLLFIAGQHTEWVCSWKFCTERSVWNRAEFSTGNFLCWINSTNLLHGITIIFFCNECCSQGCLGAFETTFSLFEIWLNIIVTCFDTFHVKVLGKIHYLFFHSVFWSMKVIHENEQ